MNATIKVVLILLYPILLVARVLNLVLGRDPLRLRHPETESFWIAREVEPDRASFFSETSVTEGRGHGGMGRIAAVLLNRLARMTAPRRTGRAERLPKSVDREQGIPDEVYTLW